MTPWTWVRAKLQRKDIGGRFFPGVALTAPGQPINQSWDVERAIREGYKQNNVVRDCIHIRSTTLGRFQWYVEGRNTSGDWLKIDDHPLELRLKTPHIGITGQNLIARTLQHLDLAGNALWEKVGDGDSMELWPLQPARIRPYPAATGFIGFYEYTTGIAKTRQIPAERVVHFQFPDPGNEYWGQSTIQSSATMIDSYNAAVQWNRQALSNNVLASMHFSSDQPLSKEDYENLQNEINRNYGVDAGGARRPIVTGSGMKAEMLNWKAQELDFAMSLAFYRDQIAHGFGVPLPVLGELSQATHSNVQEVIVDFLRTTMKPIAEMMRDVIQVQLLPDFGDPATQRVCFDTANFDALNDDMTARVEQLKGMVTNGVPLNAALLELDFDIDPVEGGDVGLVSNLLMPLTMAVDLAEEQLAAPQTTAAKLMLAEDTTTSEGRTDARLTDLEDKMDEQRAMPTSVTVNAPPISFPSEVAHTLDIPAPIVHVAAPDVHVMLPEAKRVKRTKHVRFVTGPTGAMIGAEVTEIEEAA